MTDEKDPVRVGRFEWERLMLMSVPHPQNFKLLPLGIFMSEDGSRARPGNAGLAMFGPHEKTWAKVLRWAVAEGWLVQVERGGARRGPDRTTIKRASVYAASVPQPVWERRLEILGAPPFRAAGVEGSAQDPSDALKGAPDDSPEHPESMKGAPETPFNPPDGPMKGAPRDSLPESMKGAPGVFEGSDPSFEGSVSGFEGSAQTLPHHVVPSRSSSSSTSTTTGAEVVALADARDRKGGGGGDDSSTEERAKTFVSSLDFQGKTPSRSKRADLTARVAEALAAGWNEKRLRTYLDLGGAVIGSPVGVYLHRLSEDELPDVADAQSDEPLELPDWCGECADENPAARFNASLRKRPDAHGDMHPCHVCHPQMVHGDMWDRAMVRARHRDAARMAPTGTDDRVAGWMRLSQQFSEEERMERINGSGMRPSTTDQRVAQGQALAAKFRKQEQQQSYSNDNWDAFDEQARMGIRPEGSDRYPWCGDPDCDEISRTRDTTDGQGYATVTPCGQCHPDMQF